MSDNQLPKATMSNFIREHIKDKKKVSAEFTTLMLDISKGTRPLTLEFIDRVSAQANDICEKEGKKTINNEHLYKSLQELGMESHIPRLQKLDESLKLKHLKKQEVKKQVQEKIEQMNKEHDARVGEGHVPTSILLEPRGNKTILINDQEEDFREYLDEADNDEEDDPSDQ